MLTLDIQCVVLENVLPKSSRMNSDKLMQWMFVCLRTIVSVGTLVSQGLWRGRTGCLWPRLFVQQIIKAPQTVGLFRRDELSRRPARERSKEQQPQKRGRRKHQTRSETSTVCTSKSFYKIRFHSIWLIMAFKKTTTFAVGIQEIRLKRLKIKTFIYFSCFFLDIFWYYFPEFLLQI